MQNRNRGSPKYMLQAKAAEYRMARMARRERLMLKRKKLFTRQPENQGTKFHSRNLSLVAAAGVTGCVVGAGKTIFFRKTGDPVQELEFVKRISSSPNKSLPLYKVTATSRIDHLAAPSEVSRLRELTEDAYIKSRKILDDAGLTNVLLSIGGEDQNFAIRLSVETVPPAVDAAITAVHSEVSKQYFNTWVLKKQKVDLYTAKHKLYTQSKIEEHLSRKPIDPNQLAANTSAGGALALGAVLTAVLGVKAFKNIRKRALGLLTRKQNSGAVPKVVEEIKPNLGNSAAPGIKADSIMKDDPKVGTEAGATTTSDTKSDNFSLQIADAKAKLGAKEKAAHDELVKRALKRGVPRSELSGVVFLAESIGFSDPREFGKMDTAINEFLAAKERSLTSRSAALPIAEAQRKVVLPIRPLKPGEVLQKFRKMGVRAIRQGKGSHLILRAPNGKSAPISVHKGDDVTIGTIASLLDELDLPKEKFWGPK